MNKEIWLPVPIKEFNDLYCVSSYGRVKRVKRYQRNGEFILNPTTNTQNQYKMVMLWRYPKYKCISVHRLVALAFIPTDKLLPHVNHKDGNKHNNHVNNLEWCTPGYNNKHYFANGGTVYKWTEAQRQAARERLKKMWTEGIYNNRPKHTEETKRKISETKKRQSAHR